MNGPKLPGLGGPNIVDLQARLTNKKLREITAQGIAKNQALMAQVDTLGAALHEAVELLRECRDAVKSSGAVVINGMVAKDYYADLVARINERIGD